MLLIAAGLIAIRSAHQLTLESRDLPQPFTLYVLLGVVSDEGVDVSVCLEGSGLDGKHHAL